MLGRLRSVWVIYPIPVLMGARGCCSEITRVGQHNACHDGAPLGRVDVGLTTTTID